MVKISCSTYSQKYLPQTCRNFTHFGGTGKRPSTARSRTPPPSSLGWGGTRSRLLPQPWKTEWEREFFPSPSLHWPHPFSCDSSHAMWETNYLALPPNTLFFRQVDWQLSINAPIHLEQLYGPATVTLSNKSQYPISTVLIYLAEGTLCLPPFLLVSSVSFLSAFRHSDRRRQSRS